jgi:Ser/Thr protein kinase RdoA (MazF antagonist)
VEATHAEVLAQELFGVTGTAVELGSQQDRNYKIMQADGTGILLKINHPSVTRAEVDLQIAVSDRFRAAGVATPKILPSRTGERVVTLHDDAGIEFQVCAFELVAGSALAEAGPMTGVLAEELGRMAARTVSALGKLEHPAAEREIQWELSRGLDVVETFIDDLPEDRRERCLAAARAAAAELGTLRAGLPRQIIHGDLTTDNVMSDNSKALWVIDLGDAGTSWRVSELAVLTADILGRTGSIAEVGRAVRGFCSEIELKDEELQAIWPLVVIRGAVLAVSGWSQIAIDPGNDYALERIEHEWQVFDRAARLDSEEVTAQLRLAAGRAHRPNLEYAPLLPDWDRAHVVDLGIRSELLDRGRWTEPGIERALMRTALESAPVAIARFGEARLSRVSLDISEAAATRARCVELRARPGTAVHAPFAGRVRAVDGGV